MVDVSAVSRICGACQRSYYTWKKKNPELEKMLESIEIDDNSITDNDSEVSSSDYSNESMINDF